MTRVLSGLVLVTALGLGTVSSVQASGEPLATQAEFEARARKAEALSERVRRVNSYKEKVAKMHITQGGWERRGPSVNVPELDPGAAGSALALLIGGALVLADRRKRQATT
ncbi:MAG TPA: hypothetical protein VJR89_22475 [Polyangiales bacterium]|nr:hypothetical protein [Polyangiales bacterium]